MDVILWISAIALLVAIIPVTRWIKARRQYTARRNEFVKHVLDLPVGYYYLYVLWFAPVVSQPSINDVIRAARRYHKALDKGHIRRQHHFDTQSDLVVFVRNRLG